MAAGFIKGITIEFSADADKLNQALKKTQTTLSRTQSELKAVNNALKFQPRNTTLLQQKFTLLKKAVSDTEQKLADLEKLQAQMKSDNVSEDTAEYRQLEREIEKTKDQLKEAEKAVKDFGSVGKQQALAVGQSFKDAGAKISSVGQTMSMRVTAPLVAGFTASAKYASDFEENLNKIDVAFGKNAGSVTKWASTAGKQFGLSQVQATSAASAFGALGKGIGLSDAQAAEMSTTLAGLSADLGSYFNMSVDESAKALEGIFTGESEALKRFGVVMTDTNLKQFAADQGLVWEQMSQSEKTALRYAFVLDKTKDAQGDFARTSDGTANSLKQFQAASQDLGTAVGTVLLPIITPIIQKITEWINKFNELSPTAQKIITVVGIIVAAVGPLLVIFGTLASAIGTIITVAATVAPVIGAIAAPVLGVVAAIAAAIAIGVALYKNWDTIKAKASEIWNAIKDAIANVVSVVVNKVKTNFTTLKNNVTKIFNGIKTIASNIWNGIKTKVSSVVNGIKSTVSSVFNSIKATASSVWNSIKNAITRPIETAKNTVKKAISKIKGFFPLKVGKIFSGLKLPHFNISGGKAPFGIGGMGTKPSISVSWYKKAMGNPYLFSNATLFGAGEAGDEILYGRNALMKDIARAVGGGGDMIVNVYGSDNMSVNELASAVEQKLITMQKRRTQAWA